MGSKIDLHPVVLILSLLIGAKLYGILGMLFAVPVAAVYLSLIHILEPEIYYDLVEQVKVKRREREAMVHSAMGEIKEHLDSMNITCEIQEMCIRDSF